MKTKPAMSDTLHFTTLFFGNAWMSLKQVLLYFCKLNLQTTGQNRYLFKKHKSLTCLGVQIKSCLWRGVGSAGIFIDHM